MSIFHLAALPGTDPPYSPAVRAGDFLFISGQASVDDRGEIIHDTFEGEMRRSMECVIATLASQGLNLAHVVQVRSYLASQEDMIDYNRIYRQYFPHPRPARTTLLGVLGNVVKFEVDLVVYAGK